MCIKNIFIHNLGELPQFFVENIPQKNENVHQKEMKMFIIFYVRQFFFENVHKKNENVHKKNCF